MDEKRDDEAQHRRLERWYWAGNTILTGLAMVAAGIAAWFAGGAYTEARRQADIAESALVESEHPFMSLSLEPRPDVIRDGQSYRRLRVTITNQGVKAGALSFVNLKLTSNPADVIPKPNSGGVGMLMTMAGSCVMKLSPQFIPAGGSVPFDCVSPVPGPTRFSAHLAGLLVYTGQSGAQWYRYVDLDEAPEGWIEAGHDAGFNREFRFGSNGNISSKLAR